MSSNFNFLGCLATVQVDPADNGGRFGLVEMLIPSGDQPPLHVHTDTDEGFHVIEGEMTLWLEGHDPFKLGPGQSVVAPHAVPHTYKITSSEDARVFVSSTPGRFVQFVKDYADPTDATGLTPMAGPPDMERLNASATEHGIQLLGPPGTLPQAR